MNEEEIIILPLTNEELKKCYLTDVIALYKSESNGNINVGRPGLVSYFPAFANMYGFDDAKEKGYYFVLNEGDIVSDKPVYKISVDASEKVKSIDLLNDVEYTDLLATNSIPREIQSM